MPIVDGEYQKLTEDEIKRRLEQALQDELGTTANAGDLVSKQLEAEARTLAQNQEEALQRVYQASYLEDATDKELDKVVDIIGLSRIEATNATGVVRFRRDTPPSTTYTIPRGTIVQTRGSTPIQFNTTQQSKLALIESWEDQSFDRWEGDTSAFSVVSANALSGSYSLEVPATNNVTITTTDESFTTGTTFTAEVNPGSGSITGFQFGIQSSDTYKECVLDISAQDFKLRTVEDGTITEVNTNDSPGIPTSSASYLEVDWSRYGTTTATLYSSESRDTEIATVTLDDNMKWQDGPVAVTSHDSNGTCLVDQLTTRSVLVDIEAAEPGESGNVGPNSITVIGEGVSGVEDVTNPIQTGNPDKRGVTYSPFILGEDEEDDEELRQRAFDSTSIGGSATKNAIETALIEVEGVRSLTVNNNRESTTVDGLPPSSFEAIVYGGTDKDVAKAIFGTSSIDSHDVGGVNGTEATYTVTSDVTNSEEVVHWSRPNELNLNLTLDLIVDDTYAGDSKIQSLVTNYIGGTDIDGSFVAGLSVGENIYEAVLKHRIVNPAETGVWEVDSMTIDSNNDGTDDTTTAGSGADILSVADNEVAVADALDGSITINTTPK